MNFELVFKGLTIGLIATCVINLWALLLNRTAGVPLPNRAAMGRWFAHIPRGTVFHGNFAETAPVPHETRIGWACHIAVGATFGLMLAGLAGRDWLADPTPLPAIVFGIVTVGFGWFLMQPGMSLGWAGARTARPWKTRMHGLLGHFVFGLALWAGAWVLA